MKALIVTDAETLNYNIRQKNEHRKTSHRLEIPTWLPQNIGPELLNKLLPEKNQTRRHKEKNKYYTSSVSIMKNLLLNY